MPAPRGNENNKALKTKEIKEIVYKDYCDHIAEGKSHKSWFYNKDGIRCGWETIETYIKEDIDFDPLHKEEAMAKSLDHWEKIGKGMMVGKIERCQPALYQMFMRNKFGWDKQEIKIEGNLSTKIINFGDRPNPKPYTEESNQ